MAYPAVHYFSTLHYKRYNFRGKNFTEHKMCFLIFSTIFVGNISHCKKNWARYDKNAYWSSSEVHACYSCQILMKLKFLDRFWKSPRISNFMEIIPVGAEFFHAEGRVHTNRIKILLTKKGVGKNMVLKFLYSLG